MRKIAERHGWVILLMLAAPLFAGKMSPDFEVVTLEHDTLSLRELQDDVVVLNIWATWCGPCIEEIPQLNGLVETFIDSNVTFIAITNEDSTVIREFFRDRDLPFLYQQVTNRIDLVEIFQKSGTGLISKTLSLTGIAGRPVHIVINKNGEILLGKIGSSEKIGDLLERHITRALVD